MRLIFSAILALTFTIASSQTREITTEQILTNKMPEIVKSIGPARWENANRYCIGNTCYDLATGKEQTKKESIVGAGKQKTIRLVENDLFYSVGTQTPLRLTENEEPEMNPTFSPDSQFIAFTRDNDLYTINLATKKETRLTNDGSTVILNGYASWVYFEEILGRPSRYRSFWWSPDSKTIAFMRMDQSKVPIFPIYDEEGQYGSLLETRYPKAGDNNPEVRIGFVAAEGSSVVWADFDEKQDQYFGMPTWKPDGQGLLVKWMNRDQNQLVVWDVNVKDGKKKKFYEEETKTWIDLNDNEMISYREGMPFLLSTKDGWRNIYLLNPDGSLKVQLTTGNFWKTEILHVDAKNKWVIFTATKENSTRTDLYRVGLDGKNLKRLSFGEYTHSIVLSPSGNHYITTYSNASTPPVMGLYDINGKALREIANSATKEFGIYSIAKTEIIRVPSPDGQFDLPMRVTWPYGYDPSKKYPVWISIYGGPNAGTVEDGWKFTQMQQWWAKEGFIQVAMDHRGSGHFGKKGMDYLYRSLGYWEMMDWSHLVSWLHERGGDSSRVLIQGFSYGGYMSSYALGFAPDYFTHAIAGGSVTDWSLYDTHYTEKFMGTPKNNSDGYKKASVLTHVPKIRGKLLLYHGTMDDNVHLQNSIQLVKKLQEAKKQFDFMVYPSGLHGWAGTQQAHTQNMINSWVYRTLLGKEMPKELLK
jgi:dipeptidyl-peptidase-4